jgi:hypothetical protein
MRRLTLVALVLLAGCSRAPIVLNYPDEHVVFPDQGLARAKLFVEFINDMRPAEAREGAGKFTTIYFPADDEWDRPVTRIYYEALVKDLEQTQLVELVPMRSQADYVMEVDLLQLGAKMSRSAGGYLLAAAAGAGLGYVLTQSPGGAIAGAVVGIGAMPVPGQTHAVTEARLRLFDAAHEPFWDRTCLGEQVKDMWTGVTSRADQAWVDQYLTVAIKRCNACLLGQLRQALLAEGQPAPAPAPPATRPGLE